MALGVVEDRCEFSGDIRAGTIVVESAFETRHVPNFDLVGVWLELT